MRSVIERALAASMIALVLVLLCIASGVERWKERRLVPASGAGEISLWPFSGNVTLLLGLQVAFWLGVAVTMFAYQVGFVERVR